MSEVPEQPRMLFMLNSLSRCQNKQGSRAGGAERGTHLCVCSKWNGKWESNVRDGSSIQGLPWDIKQILVTACCSSQTGYFLLKGATSHHASHCWKAEEEKHFSFNCPQVVKLRENHCFTQKWVNTNSCFHIPAEWSVWPDITDCGTVTSFSRVLFKHKSTEQPPAHAKQSPTFMPHPWQFSTAHYNYM